MRRDPWRRHVPSDAAVSSSALVRVRAVVRIRDRAGVGAGHTWSGVGLGVRRGGWWREGRGALMEFQR